MDHDTAYVEALGSVNTCEVLKYLGLDLPEDLFGATLRYQTDHDEFTVPLAAVLEHRA